MKKDKMSLYKGVTWHKGNKKWRARINHNKKAIFLGYFKKEWEAGLAYDNAAKTINYPLNFSENTSTLINNTNNSKGIRLAHNKITWVDNDDFKRVSKYSWVLQLMYPGCYYACSKEIKVYLHRFITEYPLPIEIDHKDRNPLNNRKSNLRPCTKSQNSMNQRKWKKETSSKFKGVCWYKNSSCWRAKIKKNGKTINLGYFKDEEDAAKAYDNAAIRLFCDFCCTNEMLNLYKD